MPPLFVLDAKGEPEIVNSRIHRNALIVDRLFAAAELRLGSGKRQEIVRILRVVPQKAAEAVRPAAGIWPKAPSFVELNWRQAPRPYRRTWRKS